MLYVLINLTIIFSPLMATPNTQTLVFELTAEFISADRLPLATWLDQLTPNRDSSKDAVVTGLKLPTVALDHPILSRVFKYKIAQEYDIERSLQKISNMPGVIWAEKSPIRYTSEIPNWDNNAIDSPPNDPYYPLQWYLQKVYAAPAWDITRGDTSVVIAIVDNGTDLDHRDLSANRWINYAERDGEDGVDDDQNGFIDDINGWDFYDDDPDPTPAAGAGNSHGTHVAGIAAASTDNRYGMAGAGWNCRIMAVRTGSGSGIYFGYEGLIYAAASGADVINLSWGSDTPSNIERITTEYAVQQGALVVAAAGNLTGPNNDHYPGAYQSVLSVAAVDTADKLYAVSRHKEWIDISAPGVNILSSTPNDGYGILSGTSMASPLVAGAAGLLKSLHPDWTPEQLRLQLILSADPIDNLNPDYAGEMGYGRLNMFRALALVRAGFDLADYRIAESENDDGDGNFEPGETIEITVEIENLLRKSSNVSGWLSSDDNQINIEDITHNFGVIQPGERGINQGQPFVVEIRNSAQSGSLIECTLILTGPDDLTQSIPITIPINPPYNQHDNGSVLLTMTNFGAIGYFDYPTNRLIGEGMRYPINGLSGLYHGSLMIGADPGYVSDCAFGDSTEARFDFRSTRRDFSIITDEDGIQESFARYTDIRAVNPLNIVVIQSAISYPNPPNDDFLIIRYQIINDGQIELSGITVAMFMDWDIVQASNNELRWDADREIGWMEYSGNNFSVFGLSILEGELGFQTAIKNQEEWPNGRWIKWSDRRKYELMQPGFDNAIGDEAADYSQFLGTFPTVLEPMDTLTVAFAILAGDNRRDLFANLGAARDIWSNEVFESSQPTISPEHFTLLSVFPQPFNGRVQLQCYISSPGKVNWVLFAYDGRQIERGAYLASTAGQTVIPLNFDLLPSGSYMMRLGKDGLTTAGVITLIR